MKWYVIKQHIHEPLIGSTVLETLGPRSRNILGTATERHSGAIYVPGDVSTVPYGTRLARIYSGAIYFDRGEEREQEDTPDTWLVLGEESDEESKCELQRVVTTDSADKISSYSRKILQGTVRNYRDNIRLRFNRRPPSKAKPLDICLRPDPVPIQALLRKYPTPKPKSMNQYVENLLKIAFVPTVDNEEWVSAPLIVSKEPPEID